MVLMSRSSVSKPGSITGAVSGSFDASVTEPRLCGRSALKAIV
jgi:hypothetical protein